MCKHEHHVLTIFGVVICFNWIANDYLRWLHVRRFERRDGTEHQRYLQLMQIAYGGGR